MRTLTLGCLVLLLAPAALEAGPQRIAHRGGARLAPESTVLAFEQALLMGAQGLEMDLHATADGVLVVCHDETVDRTTDGRGALGAMTLAEVRRLDAGYRFTPDGGRTYPYRGRGLVIPTLAEVLIRFPTSALILELKASGRGLVRSLVELLGQHRATGRVIVSASSSRTLRALRRQAPEIRTGFGASEVLGFLLLSGLDTYRPPGQVLQLPSGLVTRGLVERAHALHLEVQVFTVNQEAEVARLLALGVDGIMTDDLRLLLE